MTTYRSMLWQPKVYKEARLLVDSKMPEILAGICKPEELSRIIAEFAIEAVERHHTRVVDTMTELQKVAQETGHSPDYIRGIGHAIEQADTQ